MAAAKGFSKLSGEVQQERIRAVVAQLEKLMNYPESLNGEDRFRSIEGLDKWMDNLVTRMIYAGTDLRAGAVGEHGVVPAHEYALSGKMVNAPPLSASFGALRGAIRMDASGDGNDCLIHSTLTTTCPTFQTLSELGRIAVARHFRTVVLARLSNFQNLPKFQKQFIFKKNGSRAKVQVKNAITRKWVNTNEDLMIDPSDTLDARQPLSDDFAERLARQFNIGILLLQNVENIPLAQLRNPTHAAQMVVIHGTGAHFTPVRLPAMPSQGAAYVMDSNIGAALVAQLSEQLGQNVAQLWECPKCHRKNPTDQSICQYCKTRNPAASANKKPASQASKLTNQEKATALEFGVTNNELIRQRNELIRQRNAYPSAKPAQMMGALPSAKSATVRNRVQAAAPSTRKNNSLAGNAAKNQRQLEVDTFGMTTNEIKKYAKNTGKNVALTLLALGIENNAEVPPPASPPPNNAALAQQVAQHSMASIMPAIENMSAKPPATPIVRCQAFLDLKRKLDERKKKREEEQKKKGGSRKKRRSHKK